MTYLLAVSVTLVMNLSLNLERASLLITIWYYDIKPVKTNAEHSVVSQSSHKQVLILSALSKHGQRTVTQGYLTHPASVSVGQCFRCAVSTSQPCSLCQNQFQFWCSSTSNQRSDKGQGILIKVGLKRMTLDIKCDELDSCVHYNFETRKIL